MIQWLVCLIGEAIKKRYVTSIKKKQILRIKMTNWTRVYYIFYLQVASLCAVSTDNWEPIIVTKYDGQNSTILWLFFYLTSDISLCAYIYKFYIHIHYIHLFISDIPHLYSALIRDNNFGRANFTGSFDDWAVFSQTTWSSILNCFRCSEMLPRWENKNVGSTGAD